MEAKQCATKKPVGHWRNQIGNKKYLKTNENGNNDPKSMQHNKSNFKREVLTSGDKKSPK